MSEQKNLNKGMTSEATIPGPSNAARLYKARFDAVVEAFDNSEEEFAFRDACIDLLNDPLLPLKYRVQCGYMMAHASDEPEKEIEKAMAIVKVIEEKVGDDGPLPDWLTRIKTEFERILPGMKQLAAQIDNMSEEELKELIAAEDLDEREESAGVSSVEALTSAPGEFSI